MTILKSLRSLGIDTDDQISVVRTIRSLALTDTQKNTMLETYLAETDKSLTPDARKASLSFKASSV